MNAARAPIKFVFWGILINSYLINSGAERCFAIIRNTTPTLNKESLSLIAFGIKATDGK